MVGAREFWKSRNLGPHVLIQSLEKFRFLPVHPIKGLMKFRRAWLMIQQFDSNTGYGPQITTEFYQSICSAICSYPSIILGYRRLSVKFLFFFSPKDYCPHELPLLSLRSFCISFPSLSLDQSQTSFDQ